MAVAVAGQGTRWSLERYSNVQCQICYKWGHPASNCYHRNTPSSQPGTTNPAGTQSGPPQFGPPQFGPPSYYGPPSLLGPPPRYGASAGTPSYGPWSSFGAWPPFSPYWPAMAPSSRPSPRPPQALLTGATSANTESNCWFPDSGATHHVTNDVNAVEQVSTTPPPEHVLMGNGQGLPVQSIGSTSFPSPLKSHRSLYLHNLLLVPSITKNLVSVRQFAADNKCFLNFMQLTVWLNVRILLNLFFGAL